jgi:hypothetical protein
MKLAAKFGFGSAPRREPEPLSPPGPPLSAERLRAEIDGLRAEKNWAAIDAALQDPKIENIDDPLLLRDILVGVADSLANQGQIDTLRRCLARLEFASIDENTLAWTDKFIPMMREQKKTVFTTDPARTPKPDEFVILYGNYPYLFDNIVINNPMKRNFLDFWTFQHDVFESEPCWEKVEQIYVLNLDARVDRWANVLRELGRMGAPFQRITRVSAIQDQSTDDPALNGHFGCLRSHISMMEDAISKDFDQVLILEDDFCFTEDINTHKTDLQEFLNRSYDYFICLVATSKYGRIVARDDLVSTSLQPCTNTAGYLVSRPGMAQVREVMKEGLQRLIETRESEIYAADRYWAKLQPTGKFLTFRRKLGFQTPSFSTIEQEISCLFD